MAGRHSPFDLQIKLLMIGDSGVGKTCLLLRYANDSFSHSFISTIGIDFKIRNIVMDEKRVKLQIWDTAGQERFRTITTSYFRGAQGVLLVYDVNDRESFASIRNWIAQIQIHAEVGVNKILIGNKCDKDERVVTKEEAAVIADEFKIDFMETSAKANINVEKAFLTLAKQVKSRVGADAPGSQDAATAAAVTKIGAANVSSSRSTNSSSCC